MAGSSGIDKQMPHHMVIPKALHRIEDRTDCIAQTSRGDKDDKGPRGVAQEDGEEENHRPAHNQIDCKAHRRDGA